MAGLSTSTWGDPTAAKRVLLIHGMSDSSLIWHRVAQGFASRGYLVTAPDLLGHGRARRGSDYTIPALAEELRPLLTVSGGSDHPYDIVVGHSFGGVVAIVLLPLLKSTRPVQVILVDPFLERPLERPLESTASYKKLFRGMIKDPMTPEGFLQEYPLWTKENAVFASTSLHTCDVGAVEAILDQNLCSWSFTQMLGTAPENVELTVLTADPSKGSCVQVEGLKAYPHVTTKVIWGATHFIPQEHPEVIIDAALAGGNAGSSN